MDPKNMKKLIWLVVAVVVYLIIANVPISQDLEPQGQKALALMVVGVITWVAEILPIAISSLALVFMQVVIGTANTGGAAGSFVTPTFLFVLSSFFLANALLGSGLSKRLSLQLSVMSKGSPQRIILYIMLVASIGSMVISDVPVAASLFPLGLSLIEKNKLAAGKSNFAKALLIGIPFAALIGGVGTPVGSSLNVQALELLQETAGISVSFAKWAALGVPVALILTVLAWLILVFVYKPEIDKLRGLEDIDKELRELGPVSVNEKKWIVVMIILIAVWLSESVHHLPIPATTTLGAAVFFLPGFGFLDWKTQKIDWDVLLLIGAATSLGTTFYQSGAAGWLANLALGGIQGASPLVALIVVIVFTLVIHLLVPVNPAIISIMVPTLVVFSNAAGINQLTLMVPMVFTASAAFLLPLDPVPLLTYGSGHYTMGEFFKAGWILSIAWAAVLLILMLILGGPLGML